MPVTGRPRRAILWAFLAVWALLLTAGGAPVAAQTPTSDQIRLLQQLTPEQRAAALQAMQQGGLQGGASGGLGSLFGTPPGAFGLPSQSAAPSPFPSPTPGVTPLTTAPQVPPETLQKLTLPPQVRAGDVLVVRTRPPTPEVAEGAPAPPEEPWQEDRHRVDRDGRLWIPGEAPLAVLGWTVQEVSDTLSSLAFGQGKEVDVRLLPRPDRIAGLGLMPFGYDLFGKGRGALWPDPNAPVAKDYVVGPGDTFLIQLFGKESAEYELGVTRDGTLLVPKFGPLQVAGLPFDEARTLITTRIKQQAIGVEVGVTMGQLRTLQVFVLGDVVDPGLHVVSAFATPLHALLAAQGVGPAGSLRHVEVKRGGAVVQQLDLYDVLLSGDTAKYGRLQPGDVVFVPPVSGTVAVAGLVRRPAIYELAGGETVADLLALAGGVAPEADRTAVRVQRQDAKQGVEVLDLGPDGLNAPVRDGDLVQVFPRVGPVNLSVTVRGHVAAPGVYAWRPGMRLLDLLPDPADLPEDTDPRFILVGRETGGQRIYLQTSLTDAAADPEDGANLALEDGDEVFVFALDGSRIDLLAPEVNRIRRAAVAGRVPDRAVEIQGEVHFPGAYPLTEGMRLTDLIVAAGDVTERAYPYQVEITRFRIAPHGEGRETEHLLVDLARARAGEPTDNVALQPDDKVNVRATPSWQGEMVTVSGEVRFPGVYVIEAGETISSLVARAGGLTEEAFLPGAVFLREQVRVEEQSELDRLANTFEQDMVRLATQPATFGSGDKGQALVAGRELLHMIRETKATGRMSLTLEQDRSGRVFVREASLRLTEGDRLHIPRRPDSVLVVGEVYHPTAHLFRKGMNVRNYVELSGGVNKRGNPGNILVVHANGSVSRASVRFLHGGERVSLGDTIVVPEKLPTFSGLKLATDVTQILYQVALTAASAKAIGVF